MNEYLKALVDSGRLDDIVDALERGVFEGTDDGLEDDDLISVELELEVAKDLLEALRDLL